MFDALLALVDANLCIDDSRVFSTGECGEEHHHEEEGAEFGHQKNGRGAEPRSVTIVRTVPDGLESMVSRL